MSGRSWTTKEENEMLRELSEKVCTTQIALNHNRTEGAIRSRQRHLAAQLFQGGNMNIEEIMVKCRMNKKQVLRALERRDITHLNTQEVSTQTDGQHLCALCGHSSVCQGP
jgi:hypothetical protein